MTASTSTASRRRGRPPLEWLSADALRRLGAGTAVTIETHGRHGRRTTGRITLVAGETLHLDSPIDGHVELGPLDIKRGRTIAALYEPGDAVVRRGVDAEVWRGGVVQTRGTRVLVEQIDGSFVWTTETDIEAAEARVAGPPPLRRGPVPRRK